MKKLVKFVLIPLVGLLIIGLVALEWYLEAVFSNIINDKPDRAYNISYEDLDLHTFFKGLTLESAEISPLNVSDTASIVRGTVDLINISGIRWRDLIFSKQANVRELIFIRPEFKIEVNKGQKKHKSESRRGLQELFGDILSRGEIRSFVLENGSVEARLRSDSLLITKVENFNLEAREIETDSMQARHLIPFKVNDFYASIDSSYLRLNEYTEIRTGYLGYDDANSELELNNLSMAFTKDPRQVSDIVGEQVDLIQADIKQLQIEQLDAKSKLYTDLDIRAESVIIDGLVLRDFRDKNKPRPADVKKPMFRGMLALMPIPIKVDSIIIKNTEFYYSELGVSKEEPGTVHFSNVNGYVVNTTTIPEYQQQYQSFNAHLTSRLNRVAKINMNLEVPYDQEVFKLQVRVSPFELETLNSSIIHMAGVEVTSGTLQKMDFIMNASETKSDNRLMIDYDSLGLAVLKDAEHHYKKRGLVSSIANSVIRQHNLPEHKHYHIAEYESYRNIYRGPFNYMWETAKLGMMFIVPTGTTGLLVGNPEKKARKKMQKQHKKAN